MSLRFARLVLAVCAAVLLAACGGDDEAPATATASGGPPAGCTPGEWLRDDGDCVPPGLPPDMPCPPGEWLREADGACIPAGVPPDACGDGFVHDGDRGCEPILPAEPCPEGLMAVPGDTRCAEVAPCAAGRWGGIPVEADTEYVDASYTGGASDGSQAAPWTTIQQGVDAAAPSAIVAIAEGTYAEDVVVQGQPVRLWGKCPALVELSGTGAGLAALFIQASTSGTEIRRLAISGQATGVMLSGSEEVLVEEAWIRDNTVRGINVQDDFGPTSLTIRRSLVERNQQVGVCLFGSDVMVDATVVRETVADSQGLGPHGIFATSSPVTGARATIAVVRSLLERNHDVSVLLQGSDATIDATVVRDTSLDAQGLYGRGMNIREDPRTHAPANVTLTRSLVERNHDIGVFVQASDVTIEATVVRDTLPDGSGLYGLGIAAHDDPVTGARSSVSVARSLLERNHDVGLFVAASDATVDATLVRDTLPNGLGRYGRGISIQHDPATGVRAGVTIMRSLLERNHETAVFIAGSEATMDATVVRGTLPDAHGAAGRGVQIQGEPRTDTSSTLRASLVEQSVEAGVLVAGPASAEIEACVVRDTASNASGAFGDGVVVFSVAGPASTTIVATRIEGSARAAVSSFGAVVAIESSRFVCQSLDLAAEPWNEAPADFEDAGGVLCGCPEATAACVALSSGLEPPQPTGGNQ